MSFLRQSITREKNMLITSLSQMEDTEAATHFNPNFRTQPDSTFQMVNST